jgi:hypothetical protein
VLAFNPGTTSSVRRVIARKPARKDVHLWELRERDLTDVSFQPSAESVSENKLPEVIDLDLPQRFDSCAFEAKIDPSDTRKQTPMREFSFHFQRFKGM